ncbi:MAG: hypothetical protein CFE45_07300, partial [Burkholderiales bacterium PBB5]
MLLRFTQELQADDLRQLRLRSAQGRLLAPSADDAASLDSNRGAQAGGPPLARELRFERLAAGQAFTVVWPARLRNAGGNEVLASARRLPPPVLRIGPYPPLAKFGANFGIAEKAIGGVVPLTVRDVEGSGQLRLRTLRVDDEAGIIEALRTLGQLNARDDAMARTAERWGDGQGDSDDTPSGPEPASKAKPRFPVPTARQAPGQRPPQDDGAANVDSRSLSWLQPLPGTHSQALPRQLPGQAFEVLGIPLRHSGLHLLEVESRRLGRTLLDANQPMFVRAGALVTDLGVHLHLSQRVAAVWVTRLSNGTPVADAQIGLFDCHGQRLARGHTGPQGWAQIELPARERNREWGCSVYAFARTTDDLGLVASHWQRGIERWRFENLSQRMWADTQPRAVHAVLARNLLRPGEELKATLYWRQITRQGSLAAPAPADLPTQVGLVHVGSDQRLNVPVHWTDRGNAELSLRLPTGIKRGAWRIDLGVPTEAGEFRVEDFRLPVLKAEVLSPAAAQVLAPEGSALAVPVALRLSYLSGGAAGNETVQLAQRLLPWQPRFDDYADYSFGLAPRWGWRSADDEEEASATALSSQVDQQPLGPDKPVALGADGTRSVTAVLGRRPAQPQMLLTEMSYRDPNGETYRAQGRTPLWPASVVLGVKLDHWASGSSRQADYLALDTQGRPQAGVAIRVSGRFDGWVVYRRKTTGGFYAYQQERQHGEARPLCEGVTDAQGHFLCRYSVGAGATDVESGEFLLSAQAQDAQGRPTRNSSTLWLYNGEQVWFAQSDHDRMDVIAEKTKLAPGEVATLQVRSPFREATAWVTVMRGDAVVDTLVLPLHGQQPTIALPIKPSYAPNVFVNVLAVRGRVAQPAATALVDLARPAFKLGIAHLEVGTAQQALTVSVRTDKPRYQVREQAQVSLQVSSAGGPLPAGRSVTVLAVDEALLELLPNPSWNLLQAMLVQRGYDFETASAAMQVIGKRHYGRKALPAGGGGGGGATRELFDTLLLWRSEVALDAEGRAQLTVPLNDSLSRFRVVVVADAGADRFGTGQASFTTSQDLQLLPGLPATVRAGDHYSAAFTLRNTTDVPLQATVSAQFGDQTLPPKQLSVPPQSAVPLAWPVTVAPPASGTDLAA